MTDRKGADRSAPHRNERAQLRQKAEDLLRSDASCTTVPGPAPDTEHENRLLNLEVKLLHEEVSQLRTELREEKKQISSLSRLLGITAHASADPSLAERIKMEAELAMEREFIEAIFNSVPGMLYLYDDTGKLVRWNRKHEQMTGYTAHELAGMSLLDWYKDDPESQQAVTQGVNNTLTTGFGEAFANLQCKDGTTLPMYFTASLLHIHNKQYFVGIGLDITELKKSESDKENLHQQLLQAQKMESVGRLAGGVAHDFNNMLSVILGHAEMVMSKLEDDDPKLNNLREIYTAAQRSATLIRQLLGFARKQTISPKPLDLNNTVDGMLKMLHWLIGEDIDLAWLPGENLLHVKMDPSQLDQILANLCVNARDAITGVGKITIETGYSIFDEEYCAQHNGFKPGRYIQLAVSDNGSGMDQGTLQNIFEPYFTTKESSKGTGLGLSTIYGIVKQNNGFINVYSELNQGTAVRIYLPICEEDEITEPVIYSEKDISGGSETILLAEDEKSILDLSRAMLERLGYTVLIASTPEEALEIARTHDGIIDLLMTDVIMPGMNGKDLSKALCKQCPQLKTLYMSGYTANVIAHHSVLDAGVHFLPKPFSLDELASALRLALE